MTAEQFAAAVAAAPVDPARVTELADKIIEMMIDDCHDSGLPWSLRDFDEADEHTDKNMYYEYAGQHFDGTPQIIAEVNAVHDELDRRLRDGVLVADVIEAANASVQHVIATYGSWERYREAMRSLVR